MSCRYCDGTCTSVALDGLLTDELRWLWDQLAAAADRRGDPDLTTRSVTVLAPARPEARAAAVGLLGSRTLTAGQRRRVDLADLAHRLAPLTPGAVAAHAVRRRLAMNAAAKAERKRSEAAIRARLIQCVPQADTDDAWAALRRAGWVSRLVPTGDLTIIDRAAAVIAALPVNGDPPVDRRRLAHDTADGPHALDPGQPLTGLTLSLLTAIGRVEPRLPPREAWAAVGVRYDDIVGGLTTVGLVPVGWVVPAGAPVTLPPRVLAECEWPAGTGRAVYVTENPSVLSAATALPTARVVCTTGTPSRTEITALARLAANGWHLRVRADFDDAGLGHVAAILASAPRSTPWRMTKADYLAGLERSESKVPLRVDRLPATPWDPELRDTMATHRMAVFEESYLDELADDIMTTSDGFARGR